MEELEIIQLYEDPNTIFIKVMNIEFDYDPLALKFYLEYCTGNRSTVSRMVVSPDMRHVYVTFTRSIGKC